MAYTPSYNTSDMGPIFVDTVGLIGATLNSQIGLIVLLIIITMIVSIVIGLFAGVFDGLLGGITKRFHR